MNDEAFEILEGIRVNGENITNVRFSDDTVFLAENETEPYRLITALNDKYEECGMILNEMKRKVMLISKDQQFGTITIFEWKIIAEVDGYCY